MGVLQWIKDHRPKVVTNKTFDMMKLGNDLYTVMSHQYDNSFDVIADLNRQIDLLKQGVTAAPRAYYDKEGNFTEIQTRDVTMFWTLIDYHGETLELGYCLSTKELIGVRLFGFDVSTHDKVGWLEQPQNPKT